MLSSKPPARGGSRRTARRQCFLLVDLVSLVAEFTGTLTLMYRFQLVCREWQVACAVAIDARLVVDRHHFDIAALPPSLESSAGRHTSETETLPPVHLQSMPTSDLFDGATAFSESGSHTVRIERTIAKHTRGDSCEWFLTSTIDRRVILTTHFVVSAAGWSKRVTVSRASDHVVCTNYVIASSDDEDGDVKYVPRQARKHPDRHYDFALCHLEGSVGERPSRRALPLRRSLQRAAGNMLSGALGASGWPLEYFRRVLPTIASW